MKKNRPSLLKKLAQRWRERRQRLNAQKHGIAFRQRGGEAAPQDKDGITVILNVYKRAGYLAEQVAALRAQTRPPEKIYVWCDESDAGPLPDFSDIVDGVIASNHNWKFWSRFALAGMARTKYVAVIDDDILPQPRWFENCLHTIANGCDGILGGYGVLLPAEGGYSAKEKIGWSGRHSPQAEVVDMVGHSWFCNKRHLAHMWREEPYSWDNGEDLHISYTALKYGGIKCYIPPHPPDAPDMWSCNPQFGKIAGGGAAATYKRPDHQPIRDAAVRHYQANGWETLARQE